MLGVRAQYWSHGVGKMRGVMYGTWGVRGVCIHGYVCGLCVSVVGGGSRNNKNPARVLVTDENRDTGDHAVSLGVELAGVHQE